MNAAFERVIGCVAGKAPTLRLSDLVSPQDRDQIDRLIQELISTGRDSFGFEGAGVLTGERCTHWTVWRASAEQGGSDRFLILENLPERIQTDERAQQSQRWEALGRLAGGVFHDFNNLLTGVTLYCDLLLAGLESNPRLQHYVEEVRSAGLHATGLVRQLLLLARQPNPAPQMLSLNEIAHGIQDLLARLISENIAIRYRLAPDLGLVKIDRAQAQQILLNLVLNARDALPEGGAITVETSNYKFHSLTEPVAASCRDGAFPCILLLVSDNGQGMDANTRERLFEPFFTTKSPERGSGLGLSTIHSIVSRNGGLIHVDSEPGRGTRMMILFPSAGDPTTAPGEMPGEVPTQDSETTQTRLQANTKDLTL